MALNHGFHYHERVGSRHAGLTVLDYLSQRYRHSSQTEWKQRLENGFVFLNGAPTTAETLLRNGQSLVWKRPPWREPDVPLGCGILYKDEDLLAVAKPRGLPTVPAGGFLEHTLLTLVRRRFAGATPVHRLGRGTSGIILFARTAQARSALTAALRSRQVSKVYRALVDGRPAQDHFSIEVPIGPVPHPLLGTVHAASSCGKRAFSRVKVLQRNDGTSLLQVHMETGRPHQIRIHLAAAGHPLTGDPLYTPGGRITPQNTALPGDIGYFLHAESIQLNHPVTGNPLELLCHPPPELRVRSESCC